MPVVRRVLALPPRRGEAPELVARRRALAAEVPAGQRVQQALLPLARPSFPGQVEMRRHSLAR
jgi:hypothetical protein